MFEKIVMYSYMSYIALGQGQTTPCGLKFCTNIMFDPRPGRCVVSLSKRHLLPKSTGNTQE